MLVTKFAAPTISVSDARVTISSKITSALMQNAIERGRGLLNDLRKSTSAEDVLDILETLHQDWDILETLPSQVYKIADDFWAASKVLLGEIPESTSAMVEAAKFTRGIFDALREAEPAADDAELLVAAEELDKVASALHSDGTVAEVRFRKFDNEICRRAVVIALSKIVDDEVLEKINSLYEAPEDFQLTDDEGVSALHDAAQRYLEAEATERRSRAKEAKSKKRAEARKQLLQIWGTSHA